jgi:hypothetical protein
VKPRRSQVKAEGSLRRATAARAMAAPQDFFTTSKNKVSIGQNTLKLQMNGLIMFDNYET